MSPARFIALSVKLQTLVLVLYVVALPSPRGPCILQSASAAPASPYCPSRPGHDCRIALSIPMKVQPEYNARKTLWATTNAQKMSDLLKAHGLCFLSMLIVLT